jgi:hypothetical protein
VTDTLLHLRSSDLSFNFADGNDLLPPPDAHELVELMDRIKKTAKTKGDNQRLAAHAVPTKSGESTNNPRRKYQEYFQTRQQAAVMVDEYLGWQKVWKDQQVEIIAVFFSFFNFRTML